MVDHERPPVPLLVDKNIDYRVRKMCYSATWLRWDMRAYLQALPPLYGIWHPYKYCVEMLHRRFLPLFVFM